MSRNSYVNRNALLKSLGFASYHDYLESELWIGIRARVYKEYGRVCRICSKRAECVHHQSYSKTTLQGTSIDHLVPLCKTCHDIIEFDSEGSKRTFEQAVRECSRLIGTLPPLPQKSKKKKKKTKKRRGGYRPKCGCGNSRKANRIYCKRCERLKKAEDPLARIHRKGRLEKKRKIRVKVREEKRFETIFAAAFAST